MSKAAEMRVYERSRMAPQVPTPMHGWCVCKKYWIKFADAEGRILMPTSGATGMEIVSEAKRKQMEKGVARLQVVAVSPEYHPPRSMQPQKTPFEPGAWVTLNGQPELAAESEDLPFPVNLPEDHIMVAIHSVSAWTPGKLPPEKLNS